MEDISSIVARHPRRELDIRRLYGRDEHFRSVCRDYEEAAAALRHWQGVARDGGLKARDYASFLKELDEEILARLDRNLAPTSPAP